MKNLLTTQDELSAGKTTLQELVEQYIEQIEDSNDTVNAIVSVNKENARARAASIQKKIDDGSAGKLAGSVIAVKDVICEKGKQTTCASNILRNFESVYNATVIEKLAAEDALLLGRTNMDEFAMGSSTENTIFGPARNPHNTEYVTGGSSGG
ncbi:MAG: Asp-tRNA(Asn)/Glu-tRNA(Gln) amidotransferase subunit GatA, partial [Bacteroidetes bacterium]|nr:Asp-tRNA(Asn)/Glu-tRNA(Gln) amidotransferase subunit GatA [Bacteroidota bacterium]